MARRPDPPVLLSALTGVLLSLCYPKIGLGFLAWFALVPFLLAVGQAQSARSAAKLGLIAGSIFFGISLHWMVHVSTFGWVFLALLETSFFVLFAWLAYEGRNQASVFLKMIWIAAAWTAMEILRSEFPVFGMGWNLLAYSQARALLIAQAANTVGAYGLGFVMAFVNAGLAEAAGSSRQEERKILKVSGFLALAIALLLGHGLYHLNVPPASKGELRVAVIQGNIPQNIKWETMARDKILEIYLKLTELAGFENPDLVVWPEAAFPGYFNRDPAAERVYELVKKTGVPLLVGSPHLETHEVAFNSAYLIDAAGELRGRYDKRYLVPFGEYVPLKLIFGFLEPLAYTLGVSNFTEGREAKLFDIMNGEIHFSTLICFEDIFPGLARDAAKGAAFLAVITNDAWFGDTGAPFQHLQASVFRAIENGIPVVRAANTGVSGFISAQGRVLETVRDAKKAETFSTGQKTYPVPMQRVDTLYRRGGWVLPYLAPLAFVIMIPAKFRRRAKAKSEKS